MTPTHIAGPHAMKRTIFSVRTVRAANAKLMGGCVPQVELKGFTRPNSHQPPSKESGR